MNKFRVIGLIPLLVPGLSFAHAGLVKSSPGSRSVLSQAPASIELCFNEAVELKFSSIKLLDSTKAPVEIGPPEVKDNPKCVHSKVPALRAGVYTVNYRILSQDGHVVEYGYQFTVKSDAARQ